MSIFTSHTERLRRKTEKKLEEYNRPSINFFVLITLAAALASIGLLLDNPAIIIGAMVVAPLVTPVFGFSLSLIILHIKKAGLSLLSILMGTILAIVMSILIGWLALFIEGKSIIINNEILSRAEPSLLYFLVALFSGIAGAYAYAKPKVVEAVTGIAISVAIIPPLSVIGLGIAMQNWPLTQQSFILYLLNLIGICFGSIIMFLILGFGRDVEKITDL